MSNSWCLWLRSFLILGFVFSTLIGQQSSSAFSSNSDAFFLDLGVVIEPATGKEEVDRYIKSPPEEASFFLDKKPSGSVYMATTKQLHETLLRIHEKIEGLETNLHNEMTGFKEENFRRINDRITLLEKALGAQMTTLRTENKDLRGMISDLLAQEAPVIAEAFSPSVMEKIAPPVPGVTLEELTVLEPEEDAVTTSETPPFNRMVYMNGVLAYQRGDYGAAVGHLEKLSLAELDDITAGNILWLRRQRWPGQQSDDPSWQQFHSRPLVRDHRAIVFQPGAIVVGGGGGSPQATADAVVSEINRRLGMQGT